MKSLRLSVLAATLLFAAVGTSAAEPKTYAVRFDDVWKAGDVVTRQSKQSHATHFVVKQQESGQVFQEQKGSTTTSYRRVDRCLAAEGGKASRRLLYFASWSLEREGMHGNAKDDSLTATHVEVSRSGATGTWKVLTPGKELAEPAKAWLEERFGGEASPDVDALLSPKDPVAPGATWSPDVAALAKAFGQGMDVDVGASSATVTFAEVEATKAGDVGRFPLAIRLKTRSLTGPQGTLTWREGGILAGTGVLRRRLAEGALDGEQTTELKLEGVAEVAPGVLLTFDHTSSDEESAVTGGEMPPVPAAAAAPAPVQPPPK